MPRLTLRLPKPGSAPDMDDDGPPASADAMPPAGPPTPAAVAALGSLSDLPVAGLTRRRIALLIGALVAAWVMSCSPANRLGERGLNTARGYACRERAAGRRRRGPRARA